MGNKQRIILTVRLVPCLLPIAYCQSAPVNIFIHPSILPVSVVILPSKHAAMKTRLLAYFLISCFLFLIPYFSHAQCSICTKTTQQLGEGPAAGLNTGILYLAFAPFIIVGYIGYKWWQKNKGE